MKTRLFFKKLNIAVKDNILFLSILSIWFLCGFLIYYFVLKLGFINALKASFFFKQLNDDFSSAYNMWSQGIVFGVIFTFLLQNVIEKYNPERSCRMISKEMENHIIVIGYTHLGERLVDHFIKNNMSYCLIEKDKEKVDELLRKGEPIIIDDAKEIDALEYANIKKALSLLITSNNLETSLIVTKRVHQLNPECKIIARCFQDEFAEIIESLGAYDVISSSKNAFEDIIKKLQ